MKSTSGATPGEAVAPPLRTTLQVVTADGEQPIFRVGDKVAISLRFPVGHYRVPRYIRGKNARVEAIILPRAVDNEEEGFGRNAGQKGYYYRVAIPMADLWPGYSGSSTDGLRIEVYETWLERIEDALARPRTD